MNWEKTNQSQTSWQCCSEILIISILLKLWTPNTAALKHCAETTQAVIVYSWFMYNVPRFGFWTIKSSQGGPGSSHGDLFTNATLETLHRYLYPDKESAESSVTFSPPVFLGFCKLPEVMAKENDCL